MHTSKLKWKCRKGVRELDILLSKYIETSYDSLSVKEKDIFVEFIEKDTYEILDILMDKKNTNNKFLNIVEALKSLN
jgi:antitoxin CptB|tara:strand:- start:256 stop:486 length:231 start_codon:yes stop_codon:yes gene_type:complete